MQELSLNILDIAENSVKAGASLITVAVCYRPAADRLTVTISDDGCGMDAETVHKVTDPFYTTRTTRRVGHGPAAVENGGRNDRRYHDGGKRAGSGHYGDGGLWDKPHRPAAAGEPAPDVATLTGGSPEKDFRLEFDYDGARFAADTREYRAVLGEEISLAEPEVLAFITGQVAEGIAECCPAPEKL